MEDYTPRFVGDLSRPLLCTFETHDGSVDPLTGATGLTIRFRNRSSGTVIAGSGTWTNINGSAGTAVYNWSAADVATAGFFDFQISATMTDGSAHWDERIIEFQTPI